jgi:hypothetical protein
MGNLGGGLARLSVPGTPASISAPFADRELNGTQLLEELTALRAAGVTPAQLLTCDRALNTLQGMAARAAADELRQVAVQEFAPTPALAQLLVRWAQKVRLDGDVEVLRGHVHRLALNAALLAALWQAAARLSPRRSA